MVKHLDIFRRTTNGKSVIAAIRVIYQNGEQYVLGAVIGGDLVSPIFWDLAVGERILELRLWFTSTTPDAKVRDGRRGRGWAICPTGQQHWPSAVVAVGPWRAPDDGAPPRC